MTRLVRFLELRQQGRVGDRRGKRPARLSERSRRCPDTCSSATSVKIRGGLFRFSRADWKARSNSFSRAITDFSRSAGGANVPAHDGENGARSAGRVDVRVLLPRADAAPVRAVCRGFPTAPARGPRPCRRESTRAESLDFALEFLQRGDLRLDLGFRKRRQLRVVLMKAGRGRLHRVEAKNRLLEISARQLAELGITRLREDCGKKETGQQTGDKNTEELHSFNYSIADRASLWTDGILQQVRTPREICLSLVGQSPTRSPSRRTGPQLFMAEENFVLRRPNASLGSPGGLRPPIRRAKSLPSAGGRLAHLTVPVRRLRWPWMLEMNV